MQNFEIAQKIRDIREKISELRDEGDILEVKIQNKISEVESIRQRRDELNNKVKDLSRKPKEILAKRKEVWENIEEMNEEKRNLYKEMQPYLQRIGELRKVRDAYNQASRGTLERLLNSYEGTINNLLKDDISLKNELYLYNFLFEIKDRLLVKARADVIHREIVRIKEVDLKRFNEVMGEMEDNIGEMKSESHEGLQTAKELWTMRDNIREEAQNEHKAFLEGMNVIKNMKREVWKLRKEVTTLYREIDDWKKEFKKGPQDRLRSDMDRKLQDALAKYKRGESLSLEELSLLVESGNIEG